MYVIISIPINIENQPDSGDMNAVARKMLTELGYKPTEVDDFMSHFDSWGSDVSFCYEEPLSAKLMHLARDFQLNLGGMAKTPTAYIGPDDSVSVVCFEGTETTYVAEKPLLLLRYVGQSVEGRSKPEDEGAPYTMWIIPDDPEQVE